MEYELHGSINAVVGLAPVVIATDTTTVTAIIDTKGFESLEWVISSGVLTDGAYSVVIEDGDAANLSDAAAVPVADRLGALPAFIATEDGVTKRVGTVSKKRYQRLSIVSTTTTAGGLFSVVAIQGHAHSRPVA